jgi:hypothetical protein
MAEPFDSFNFVLGVNSFPLGGWKHHVKRNAEAIYIGSDNYHITILKQHTGFHLTVLRQHDGQQQETMIEEIQRIVGPEELEDGEINEDGHREDKVIIVNALNWFIQPCRDFQRPVVR